MRISVVDQPHGDVTSAGLRFDADGRSIVYATDFHQLTGAMLDLYRGTDLWIVDALRQRPHPSHGHLSQVLAWVREVQPGRAVLTHMDQSMDYRTLLQELPPGVEPGFDGMEIIL